MPDDEDGPRDGSGAPDATWADVRAPDDISGLAADVEAYRRELRVAHRRRRRRAFLRRPGVLPLSLAVGAMALAALVATLLTVLAPKIRDDAPRQDPIAATTIAVGKVGGLIPLVALRDTSGHAVSSRDLRPAVLALVPLGCTTCGPILDALAGEAFQRDYTLDVVVPAAADADATRQVKLLSHGLVREVFDPSGTLARTYAGGTTGVTTVLLAADGTEFAQPITDATTRTSLSFELSQMAGESGISG